MIRRYTSGTGLSHSEPLHQASFTAIRGIDSSKAVTVPNVVNSLENLTVNSDGSVSVRKPLIFKASHSIEGLTVEKIIPLHVPNCNCIIYKSDDKVYLAVVRSNVPQTIKFYAEPLNYTERLELAINKLASLNVYDVTGLIDLKSVGYIHTNSSTVLNNVTVDLTNIAVYNILYNSRLSTEQDASKVYRYLQIVEDAQSFHVYIKTPEVNTLDTGSEFVLGNNLTLDNPYATRDMYDASYVSVDGILPYVYCTSKDTPNDLYVDGTAMSDTLTFGESFDTSYYDNVLPPTNPLLVEFLGDPDAYIKKSNSGFLDYGGIVRIWLNSFNFDASPTVHKHVPHTLNINASFRRLGTNPVYVNVGDTTAVEGGTVEERIITVHREQFKGDPETGFYVDLTNTPFISSVLGYTKGAAGSTFTYDVHANAKYDFEGNPREDGMFRARLKCSASDVTFEHDIYISSYDNGARWKYTGEGLFELDMEVEALYDGGMRGKWDVYFNIHDFPGNKFAQTSFDKRAAIFQWFDPESPVQNNYPILISKAHQLSSEYGNITIGDTESSKTVTLGDVSITSTLQCRQNVFYRSYYKYTILNSTSVKCVKGTIEKTVYCNLTFNVEGVHPESNLNAYVSVVHGASNNISGKYDFDLNLNSSNSFEKTLACSDSNSLNVTIGVSDQRMTPVINTLSSYTVDMVTEKVSYPKFQIVDTVKNLSNVTTILKAFMTLKPCSDQFEYYGVWEYSFDGITWKPWYNPAEATKALFTNINIPEYTLSKTQEGVYDVSHRSAFGMVFKPVSASDRIFALYDGEGKPTTTLDNAAYIIPNRPDIAFIRSFNSIDSATFNVVSDVPVNNVRFKFTVCSLNQSTDSNENTITTTNIISTKEFNFNTALNWEFTNFEFGNSVEGDVLFYNNRLYSYNTSKSRNNIFVSDPNSFITSVENVIDLKTHSDSTVRALIPWRNYLVGFTDYDVHLITPSDSGAYTKSVTTYTGVGNNDRNTCAAILNGIIFKSGSKIYTLYPNVTSGDESILNLNEVSHPINHILERFSDSKYDNFSISTERRYYIFIPYDSYTCSVVYDYDLKVWSTFKYDNVRLVGYDMDSLSNLVLYGICDNVLSEYYFDKELKEAYPNIANDWDVDYDSIPYGDYLTEASLTPPPARTELPKPQSIHFVLDSGQRTDNISLTRKFVESKFILATLNSKPAANIDVDIYIDGSPYKTRLKGDGIVFKDSPDDIITLGDDNPSDASNVYNTLSQVYLRYSGKGKTIRHVITGDSLYNFKLYEVFYRYRPMPNKQ